MSDTSKIYTFVLVDTKDSGFIKDGTENTPQEERLKSGNGFIKTESVMLTGTGKNQKRVPIRFIHGCPTIVVEEQEKGNYKPNPGFDKSKLWFTAGILETDGVGINKSLLEYLRNYHGNIDVKVRPDGAMNIFKELKVAETAEEALDREDALTRAKNLLLDLRQKRGNESVYNEAEINALAGLFHLPYMDSPAEKLDALISKANENPEAFINSIANKKQSLFAQVNHARDLGVIVFTGKAVSLAQNNKIITELKSTKLEDQNDELASFFLSEDGKIPYEQFMIEYRAERERALKGV